MAKLSRTTQIFSVLSDPKKLEESAVDVSAHFSTLIKPGANPELQELGWLGLAKLYRTSDDKMAKALNSSVQSRLILASKQEITFGTLHFARAALQRFPWLKSSGATTLNELCRKVIDFITGTRTVEYIRIAAEFYSLYTKDLTCPVLLKQLRSALNGSPAYSENANKKLHFSSEETRHQFISSVLLFHENVLKHASSDCTLLPDEWLEATSEALCLDVKAFGERVFAWIEALLNNVRISGLLMSHFFVSLFVDHYCLFKAYFKAAQTFINVGLPSNADRFCKMLLKVPASPLHLQDFGEEYADAVISLLDKRVYLLDRNSLLEFQKSMCAEAFRYPNSRPALKLMKALLAMIHDLVPTPIQVSQTIFSMSTSSEAREGLSLCQCISRPRMRSLITEEILSRSLRKQELFKDNDANDVDLRPFEETNSSNQDSKHEEEVTQTSPDIGAQQDASQASVGDHEPACEIAEKTQEPETENQLETSLVIIADEDEDLSRTDNDKLTPTKRSLDNASCELVKRARFEEASTIKDSLEKHATTVRDPPKELETVANVADESKGTSKRCESPDIEIVEDIVVIEDDIRPTSSRRSEGANKTISPSSERNQTQKKTSDQLTVDEMLADFQPV